MWLRWHWDSSRSSPEKKETKITLLRELFLSISDLVLLFLFFSSFTFTGTRRERTLKSDWREKKICVHQFMKSDSSRSHDLLFPSNFSFSAWILFLVLKWSLHMVYVWWQECDILFWSERQVKSDFLCIRHYVTSPLLLLLLCLAFNRKFDTLDLCYPSIPNPFHMKLVHCVSCCKRGQWNLWLDFRSQNVVDSLKVFAEDPIRGSSVHWTRVTFLCRIRFLSDTSMFLNFLLFVNSLLVVMDSLFSDTFSFSLW